MDFARALKLRAAAVGNEDLAEFRAPSSGDPVERFRAFVADETRAPPPPTLASVLHHLDTAGAGAMRTSPSSTSPTSPPTCRASCSAWRASSGSRARRHAQ